LAAAPDHASEIAIVLVAAGKGLRAGGPVPKQYALLLGRPLLAHTIEALSALRAPIQPVIGPGDEALFATVFDTLSADARDLCLPPVTGGDTRQASVLRGLEALAGVQPQIVLIHDGARCHPAHQLLTRAVEAARVHSAAIPGLVVTDTIKQIDAQGFVTQTPERATLRAVQTPQSFTYSLILKAHQFAAKENIQNLTDDGAVAEWAGHKVHLFPGDATNLKVTEASDFATMEHLMSADLTDIRTGQGYDVHAFGPGDHVWLGGVKIPHTAALMGHSDADVLLHALTDAILGALADGDIGSHFPPSDPQWKGAASDQFLRHAVSLVGKRGGKIAHLDGTLICEAPKVGPHRDAIRARIAEICDLPLHRVAVKATTSEGLGFTGRREGIAAMALATIRLPE
jgi:2-C-methyl-D-erythritol 4-phosphate cytidylyltransferase/2-C-methyl-D-erythritol 2,4-cyclodiphosphate synthase